MRTSSFIAAGEFMSPFADGERVRGHVTTLDLAPRSKSFLPLFDGAAFLARLIARSSLSNLLLLKAFDLVDDDKRVVPTISRATGPAARDVAARGLATLLNCAA